MNCQLGIDLGGTSGKIGAVDDDCRVVDRAIVPTGLNAPFAETVRRLSEALCAMPEYANARHLGIGAPSSINPASRKIVHANNLGWKDADIASELGKYVNIPMHIANDADCAALCETLCGAAVGKDGVLTLTIGTGIGGGIVERGRLFTGGDGFGFEPGHMIIAQNGKPCSCGRNGCFERYASASALIEMAEQAGLHGLTTAKAVFDACRDGNEAAMCVLTAYTHALAVGVSNLITLFRPNIVVIGGGVSQAGELLFSPLREIVREMTYGLEVMGCPDIVPAKSGNDAGLIGASMLHRFSNMERMG